MKPAFTLLLLTAGTLIFAGCETAIVADRPVVVHRRYIRYTDTEPYYRVYYREPSGRTYYRRYYYEDAPTYRVDTRRYYYSTPGPIDRSYGF